MRITPELRDELLKRAEATGRSITQEMEMLMERGLLVDKLMASKAGATMCQDCQGRGYPAFAPAGAAMPCRICGGSGIASCCEGAVGTAADVPGDAVVLHLSYERRLLLRQELYHAVHTLEAQARVAKAGSTRQRALTRRAADLRSVADQLA